MDQVPIRPYFLCCRRRHTNRTPGAQFCDGRRQVRRRAGLSLHAASELCRAGGRLVLQQQCQTGVPMDPGAEAAQHRRVPSQG